MNKKEKVYGVLEKKFNEKLEKSSRMFTLIGLVFTLFLVYSFIEYETVKKTVKITDAEFRIEDNVDYTSKVFEIEEIKKEPEKTIIEKEPEIEPEIENFTDIEKANDDEEIKEKETTTTTEKPLDLSNVTEVPIEEEIKETLPFITVEFAPVFPGCKGDKEQLKDCFSKKMRKHINKKFNSELGEELGLSPGRKSIYVVFQIDSEGNAIDVKSKAPHPRLSKEAERVINLLPTMIPARQGTKKVGVTYSVPITFEIH